MTELAIELATKKPSLSRTVTVILIANEENGLVENIGVDQLMRTGKMDHLRSGPVVWVDCADMHPCLGTAASIVWHLKVKGKLFHSGLPHKGVNSLELANAACAELQDRFYAAFPARPEEARYKFMTCSTMKPTQIKCPAGSLNQLPPWIEISGDIRATPFYEVAEIKAKLAEIIADMNENITSLKTWGPHSKYEIEGARGSLELEVVVGMEGVACSMDSEGHHALVNATADVLGEARRTPSAAASRSSATSSAAASIQMTGFGNMSTYHADNEYCKLSDMEKGFRILRGVITNLEQASRSRFISAHSPREHDDRSHQML